MYTHNCQKMIVLIFIAMMGNTSVYAETVAEELARISESIAILSARHKELELKAQIATKQAEIDKLKVVPPPPVEKAVPVSATSRPVDIDMPVVSSIEGIDGNLSATLLFSPSMHRQTVRKGQSIRGGWVVNQIEVDKVLVSKGNEKIQLGFMTESRSGFPGSMGIPTGGALPPIPGRP